MPPINRRYNKFKELMYFRSSYASLFDSSKYSDLTITCEGRVFKAHRMVVCVQSKPLAAAVDGNFMEGITGTINLVEDDPQIVEFMLRFLYSGSYDVASVVEYDWEGVVMHIQVYILADKYDIPALRAFAVHNFRVAASRDWDSVVTCFTHCARLAYEGTPEGDRLLKDAIAEIAYQHGEELFTDKDYTALCKEHGEIPYDMFRSTLTVMDQLEQMDDIAISFTYEPEGARAALCDHSGGSHYSRVPVDARGLAWEDTFCDKCGESLGNLSDASY